MKNNIKLAYWLAVMAAVFFACGELPIDPEAIQTQAAGTVEAELTKIAGDLLGEGEDTQEDEGQPQETAADTETAPSATAPPAPADTQAPTATPICNLAAFVTDVTVPDNTEFTPGEAFTKTWRLRNDGDCTWTSGYDLVFDSGDQMSAPAADQFTGGTVPPGGTVDVSVDLVAPNSTGTYKGFFKLRDSQNAVFGLNNNNPFWVQVKVVPPTPTPTTGLIIVIPLFNLDYTTGYAGKWTCDSQTWISLKIKNTGNVEIQSMKIRLEGPIGTYLNGFSNNKPFRPVPPEPYPQCVQSGSDSLAIGDTAWVNVHTNSPPSGGTSGRIIIELCGLDDLEGFCNEETIDFTW